MSRPRSLVGRAVIAAALLVAIVLALPTSLDGATAYVTTHGTSMEPRFHTGDLAVVHAEHHYRVGDVVAYRSDLLHTVVLHRVIAIRGGHYTFKGDNNTWIDPETPTADRLIGKLVLRVPHGGVWLARLSSPAGLSLLALVSLAGGGLMPGASTLKKRRREKRNVTSPMDHAGARLSRGAPSPSRTYVALAAAFLALLGLGLGMFAWSGPETRLVAGQQPSDRAVTFSYTAHVMRSPAYDGTTVTAPQPIFRAVATSVDVRFRYTGEPGTVSVVAQLVAASGWQSTISLAASQHFERRVYVGQVRLDLPSLAARAERAGRVIGVPADQITVNVRALFTDDHGNVFAPALPLTLTPAELAPAAGASLHVEDSATVPATTMAPRALSIARHDMTAGTARRAAVLALVLALLLGGLAALWSWLVPGLPEATAFRRRYAHLVAHVEPVVEPPGRTVVDVTEPATLAKIAERYQLMILHWSCEGVETFSVRDAAASYRLRVAAASRHRRNEVPPGGTSE